jgi:hypothetical protein
MNPGASRGDAIVQLKINSTATRTTTAVVNITYGTFNTSFRLINVS